MTQIKVGSRIFNVAHIREIDLKPANGVEGTNTVRIIFSDGQQIYLSDEEGRECFSQIARPCGQR